MTPGSDDDVTPPPHELQAEPADDALVRRLRDLEWPTVRPEVRDRCWETFAGRVANAEPLSQLPEPGDNRCTDRDGHNSGRRDSYTRRELLPRDPLAGYSRAPRRWTERPKQRFATASR